MNSSFLPFLLGLAVGLVAFPLVLLAVANALLNRQLAKSADTAARLESAIAEYKAILAAAAFGAAKPSRSTPPLN